MSFITFKYDLFYLYRVKRDQLTEGERHILGKYDHEVFCKLSPLAITEYQYTAVNCWGHNGKPLLLPVDTLDLLSCEAIQQ